jgi:hypothetical protein
MIPLSQNSRATRWQNANGDDGMEAVLTGLAVELCFYRHLLIFPKEVNVKDAVDNGKDKYSSPNDPGAPLYSPASFQLKLRSCDYFWPVVARGSDVSLSG